MIIRRFYQMRKHQTTVRKIMDAINATVEHAGVKPRYLATTAKIRRDLVRAEQADRGYVEAGFFICGVPVLVDDEVPPGQLHLRTDEPPSATGNHD